MSSIPDSPSSRSTNDEYLQKIVVGELKPHNAPITLVEYGPRWPEMFEREANRIRSTLGSKALRVERVGSTSIPGLCAKRSRFLWMSHTIESMLVA